MPQIVKEGAAPTPSRSWVYEQDITCPRCHTVFRLVEGDRFAASKSWTHPHAVTRCPLLGCGASVTFYPPIKWTQGYRHRMEF